jgi:small-conductance mechanosensitive channel
VKLDAVQRNHDVLHNPPPRVLFVGSQEGALAFEISAFVDAFAKRQRVQHEINLVLDEALRQNGLKTA